MQQVKPIGHVHAAARLQDAAAATTTLLLVFACFTAASSGYLGWLYHLMGFVPAGTADALALGVGYAFQGAGVGIAALVLKARPAVLGRGMVAAAVTLQAVCAALACTSQDLAPTLGFGYAMNLFCGVVAGCYLVLLSRCARNRRGIVFGVSYACSTVCTWLLSKLPAGLIAGLPNELAWCVAFSALSIAVAMRADVQVKEPDGSRAHGGEAPQLTWAIVVLACATVLLTSMVKSIGFDFPSADIGSTIDLESSRLLYAIGLVCAGLAIDRSRTLGAVLCMASLVVPFAMLALSGQPVPSTVLWAVDYLFYGFFSVFRAVLFSDIAADGGCVELSGFGLMLGRFGDALGACAILLLGGNTIVLVVVTAVLLAATLTVFLCLLQQQAKAYAVLRSSAEADPHEAERRAFDEFAVRHGLSSREREVARLMIDRRTNPEIADVLVVSENTVKFHVRNILKKTGCKNRAELRERYAAASSVTGGQHSFDSEVRSR